VGCLVGIECQDKGSFAGFKFDQPLLGRLAHNGQKQKKGKKK